MLHMKWIQLILLVSYLQVRAGSDAQGITYSGTNVPLKTVFLEIKTQSGYTIFGNYSLLENARNVTISVRNTSVEETLTLALKDQNLDFSIQGKMIVFTAKPGSPPPGRDEISDTARPADLFHDITGKLVNEKNEPIMGVSVLAKGGRSGSKTDSNGIFRIRVPEHVTTLVFSHIGYQSQEVDVTGKREIRVTLAIASKSLADVTLVNVGYGTLNKNEVSSAITHLTAKDLLTGSNNSVLMAINGKVAGLTVDNTAAADPNSTPTLQLRGVSSRSAGLTPLFVVDGIAGANIDNINQNDIASIDVLKGGAASAIYGTRGSNGVVLITTKRGSSMEPRTLYDVFVSTDHMNDKPKLLSARQYLANNVGPDAGGNTDWLKALTRNSVAYKHTLQLSGGSGRTNYLASMDFGNAQGVDLRSSKQQYGANINLNHTTGDNLFVFGLKVAPRYASTNTSNTGEFNQALVLNPTQPIYDSTGHYAFVPNGGIGLFNPVEDAKVNLAQQEIKELDISGSTQLNILKNLNTKVTFSETSMSMKTLAFSPSTLTTILPINGGNGLNTASQDQQDWDTKNLEWIGNYWLNIQRHSLRLLAGYSYVTDNWQDFNASNKGFPFDAYTWNNLAAGTYDLTGVTPVGSNQNADKLIAFFGRLNYDYDKRYFLMASLRHEGSSRFGSGRQWGDFPGISAAWMISNEEFMKMRPSWLNELKLRADYGVTGNQNFADYQALETYTSYDYTLYNGQVYYGLGPATNANPLLQWETSNSFNLGIDFDLFKSRLSGSLNYYSTVSKSLLGSYNVPIPPNLQTTTYLNVGSMKNSGMELQATVGVVRSSAFAYDISVTGAFLSNKLVTLSNQVYNGGTYLDGPGFAAPGTPGPVQRLLQGQRVGDFYTLHATGVSSTGQLLVYSPTQKGVVTADQASTADRQVEGNGLAKYTASMNHAFRYKNWDLSIFLRGAFGYKLFNTRAFYLGQPGRAGAGFNLLASAYEGGKYAKITDTKTAYILSDYFLEPGGFVKIDNACLGYTKQLRLKYIRSVRIYATGRNLYTFTRFKGGDPSLIPQAGLWPGANTSLSYYPATRQMLFGAQVNF
jgi:TonB-linked SusC/RagA family outer membrane protein